MKFYACTTYRLRILSFQLWSPVLCENDQKSVCSNQPINTIMLHILSYSIIPFFFLLHLGHFEMKSSISFIEVNLSQRISHQARIESMTVVAFGHVSKMWSDVSFSRLQAPHLLDEIWIPRLLSAIADGIFPCLALQMNDRILNGVAFPQSNRPSLTIWPTNSIRSCNRFTTSNHLLKIQIPND